MNGCNFGVRRNLCVNAMTTHDTIVAADPISRYRRHPATCLYCDAAAIEEEHIVPWALGGRLTATILCDRHNRIIGKLADQPLCSQLAPVMTFLDVKRQGNSVGTAFKATTDAGEVVTMGPDGKVRQRDLNVQERDASGRITRATGALEKLDALKAGGALTSTGTNVVIAVMEKSPSVNFSIGAIREIEPGVLKIALHFIAGFVGDVPRATATMLLPFVLGQPDHLAGGTYVRTWGYDPTLFPGFWPPSHVVTSYQAGELTYVTVLLCGIYSYVVRLPLSTEIALRYRQPLVGSHHPILEEATHETIDWEARLTESDTGFLPEVRRRQREIVEYAAWRVLRAQLRGAAQRALANASTKKDNFLEFYHAELQLQLFDADVIHDLMSEAIRLRKEGKYVWQIPGPTRDDAT